MKILILQDFLRSGGTERQSVLLANAFAAGGNPTSLVTFRPGGPLDSTVSPQVDRRVLQPFDTRLDWFAPGLSAVVAGLGPDIILCMGRMANCYGRMLHRRFPASAVVASMRTGKPLPWLFRRSLAVVPRIVANSHDARATLMRDYALPAENITVIHNSLVFPPESSLGRNESLRARHGASPRTVVLLCVAMFRPEKNQRELIEIVAGLEPGLDWQLWLAGDGPARAACEHLAAKRGCAGRVKFLGFLRDPSPLYGAADIAVHASWSEALSNFLIEAQAYGLPAVACRAQGIEECFVPDRTGWAIPRGDHAAFRAAVQRLVAAHPESRREIATLARTYARHTFDPARQVDSYLELFRGLTARSAS
jgi:glycosyltransferase involved in cell wall biosynthesis